MLDRTMRIDKIYNFVNMKDKGVVVMTQSAVTLPFNTGIPVNLVQQC